MVELDHLRAAATVPFLLAPSGTRLIQVHPSLRCNLRCAHCYSESGPERRGQLSLAHLCALLASARPLGYHYVGVSGGEPTLWPDLVEFLDAARAFDFAPAITTNGTTLTAARVAQLSGRVCSVGVSIDGMPPEHDALRGVAGAYDRAVRGMRLLRAGGVPFAVVFTLTRRNLHALRPAYELAESVGALALQVHPLSATGSAAGTAEDVPDDRTYALATALLALLVETRGGTGPAIAFDVVRVEDAHRALVQPSGSRAGTARRFCDDIPALVVEADGAIVPLQHGFPRSFQVAQLGMGDLATATAAWRGAHGAAFSVRLVELVERHMADGRNWIDLSSELRAELQQAPALR